MSVVDDPHPLFRSYVPPRSALLHRLEEDAVRRGLPIVGPVVGGLLQLLVRAMAARRVLELGTAEGYSALWLAGGLAGDGELIGVEWDADTAARARAHLDAAGFGDRARVDCAPALDALRTLEPPFDLVFIDIDKDGYAPALPECARLLRPGGLLVADNTAFADALPFNAAVAADAQWLSVQLFALLPGHSPECDGLCLAQRR